MLASVSALRRVLGFILRNLAAVEGDHEVSEGAGQRLASDMADERFEFGWLQKGMHLARAVLDLFGTADYQRVLDIGRAYLGKSHGSGKLISHGWIG